MIIFGVLTHAFTAWSQVTLGPGGTFTYSFNSLPLTQTNAGGMVGQSSLTFNFSVSGFNAGDQLRCELFESSTNDVPFVNEVYSGFTGFVRSDVWADRRGVVRFTMQAGSMTLNSLDIQLDVAQSPSSIVRSVLHVPAVTAQPARLSLGIQPTTVSLTFTGTVSALYRVQHSSALPTTNWTTLTNIYLPSSPFTLIDSGVTNGARRFYRIVGFSDLRRL